MTTTAASRHTPARRALAGLCATAVAMTAACGSDGGSTTNASDNPAPTTVAARKPNIVFIMADDLGYSDLGAFGSEIRTPNLDALVRQGRILANHHAAAVCAVTRSMIISGTDHHLVGEGTMATTDVNYIDENGAPKPGYEGYLNDQIGRAHV